MTITEVADYLNSHNNFDILTHAYPDGDTLGSGYALCLALQQIGKNARVITTNIPKNFQFLTDGVQKQDFLTETVVSTDVADEKLLGSNKEKYAGKIDLCIDHHMTNKVEAELKYVDENAAANCENIYRLLLAMNIKITKQIANCLYTGISTDTGCFRHTNTTSDTLRTAAALMDIGCDTAYINKVMFETKSKAKVRLERAVYDTMLYCADGKCAIINTTLEMQKALNISDDELEGLASIPRQIEGVLIGIVMREKEGGVFKVSVRTNGNVNAAEFCQKFGGGGHSAAAGCSVNGGLDEVRSKLISAAEAIL